MSEDPRGFARFVLIVFIILTAASAGAAIWIIRAQRERVSLQTRSDLAAVADIRVEQIVAWHEERLGDAQSLVRNPFLIRVLEDPPSRNAGSDSRRALDAWIRDLAESYHYAGVYLLDRRADLVASTHADRAITPARLEEEVQEQSGANSVVFLDLHREASGGDNHMDILVPVAGSRDAGPGPVGWVILEIDPKQYLGPLMRTWPFPSRTAETILARKVGDRAEFLTPLRHSRADDLVQHLSPERSDLPVMRALNGYQGYLEGRDYRGARVLAVVRRVPGTPWVLVAKIDAAEVRAPLLRRAWAVGGFFSCLVLAAGAFLYVSARKHQKQFEARDALARHYEHLSRSAHDVIMLVSEDRRIVDCNRRGEELFGYEKAEMIGQPAGVLAAPGVEAQLAAMFERLGNGESVRVELDGCHRNGTRIPVEINAAPIEVQGRRYFQGIIRDMTKWVQARDALQASEARFREVVNRYPGVFVLHDRELRAVYVNARALAMVGLATEDVIGRGYEDILSPEAIKPFMPALLAARDSGRSQTVEFEIELQGQRRYFEATYIPLTDESGAVTQILGFAHDLTERRRLEEELRKRMRAIEHSPISVVITDTHGTIEYVNPKFCEISGYAADELVGRNPRILKSGRQTSEFYREMWETISAGREWHGELWNRKKSGELYAEQSAIAPVTDEQGRISHFVAMKQDVTEWRRLEDQFRQSQKMEAVGRLAGGVAHDFNNLLTAISGFGSLAERGLTEGTPARRYLQEILRAADRAAGLTHQLLAFSRRQIQSPQVIDLNQIMEGMTAMIRRLIGEDIHLETAPASFPARILADPGQIEQVLLNLVVNARDAMPEGGRLTVTTEVRDLDGTLVRDHPEMKPGRHAVLSVQDTGVGMSEEVQAHLFEPFFTTKGPDRGTGLGLATVYGIVSQSHGCIQVESTPGRGTSFEVILPEVAQAATPAGPEPAVPGGWEGGRETVLLVEDNDGVRDLAREVLTTCGYTVLAAENGPDALAISGCHSGGIDLLLTDMVMPEMNGRALARLVAKERPDIKIIFMSGYTGDQIASEEIARGDLVFLPKPFTPADLAARVRETLDASTSRLAA